MTQNDKHGVGFHTPPAALAAALAIPSGFGVAYYTLPSGIHAYWPLFGVFGSVVAFAMLLFARGEWP